MGWFNYLFFLALVVSLFTGKAYFRGISKKEENPKRYWSTVMGYFILAIFPVFFVFLKPLSPMFSLFQKGIFYFLTDASTRAAQDLQEGVEHKKNVVELAMYRFPEGCSGRYKMQLSRESSLLVWCMDEKGEVTSSHATTSHLPYVDVPKTYIIEKDAKESVFVSLEFPGGKGLVTGVR